MAKDKDPNNPVAEKQVQDIEHLKRRLDMLDQRLDNIDSMVTVIAERIMRQPLTFNITCSNCGKNIEIALIGTEKPKQ